MPRKKTTGRVYKSKPVSFDPKLLEDAMKRAESLNMNFSDYVRQCLIKDIYRGGPMIRQPMEEAPVTEDAKKRKTG